MRRRARSLTHHFVFVNVYAIPLNDRDRPSRQPRVRGMEDVMTTVDAGFAPLEALRFTGADLRRPECVLARPAATSSRPTGAAGSRASEPTARSKPRGAHPDGGPRGRTASRCGATARSCFPRPRRRAGGVFALARDGTVRPLLEAVDGISLPPTNFVVEDARRPRLGHRQHPALARARCGYRARRRRRLRRASSTRAARASSPTAWATPTRQPSMPAGEWLYVNETFARRLSRFRAARDGALGATRDGRRVRPRHLSRTAWPSTSEGHALDRRHRQQPRAARRARRRAAR